MYPAAQLNVRWCLSLCSHLLPCSTPMPLPDPLIACFAAQLKDLLMAVYFASDHFVWAYQIGLINDKALGERFQKTSLWGWALGSVCTGVLEVS